VQEAINLGVIRYYKTLLIKNNIKEEESVVNDSSSIFSLECSVHSSEKHDAMKQKSVKIKMLQKNLVQILRENKEGVLLSQLPTLLKKKTFFEYSLHELGFPKLKNFINSLADRVVIHVGDSNNAVAFLNSSISQTSHLSSKSKSKLQLQSPQFVPGAPSPIRQEEAKLGLTG